MTTTLLWFWLGFAIVAAIGLLAFAVWFVPVFVREWRRGRERSSEADAWIDEREREIRRGARRAPRGAFRP